MLIAQRDRASRPQSVLRSQAEEGVPCLLGKTVSLSLIAGRVVERDEPLCSGKPRNCSGLPCSQMMARLGEGGVGVKECRLDEEDVRALCKPDHVFDIRVREGAIDNVSDLAASGDLHDLLLEQAKRKSCSLCGP